MYRVLIISLFICLVPGLSKENGPLEHFQGRIVGGEDADIEDFPYQVSVEYYKVHLCGGAIIGSEWIVTTAAPLVRLISPQIQIRAGTTTRGVGGTVHPASKIIPHPNHIWNSTDNDYDICLIRVTTPLEFNSQVQPIPMSTLEPNPGDTGIVTGWGGTSSEGPLFSQLQFMSVPIVEREICNDTYSYYGGMTANQFCAGMNGVDACLGDAGNPLVIAGELVGLVSWGIGCDVPDYPGVYTTISTLRDFVTMNTGADYFYYNTSEIMSN
ncbi:hypothetical protein L9F63_028189 [Diploptera punctata]|uniref:Peptidase S1 domain-containing protein n=1 Tax=Diploptera punctata TaxID=6984 RepID=A0AAD7ZXI1_DIPPU|nr:hypothetical protein L9F63_028189 [Diploptera punctata]